MVDFVSTYLQAEKEAFEIAEIMKESGFELSKQDIAEIIETLYIKYLDRNMIIFNQKLKRKYTKAA